MTSGELWSRPDEDGILTCVLDVGAISTLRGRRKRKCAQSRAGDISLWPGSWRELLIKWIKTGSARRKWNSLVKIAGGQRVHEACQLADALLKAGLIEVEERREGGRWQPVWIEFLNLEGTREAVGLPNRETLELDRAHLSQKTLKYPELIPLQRSLESFPADRAIRRMELLFSLDNWIAEERYGTRRDFALFARGDTKGISTAEWDWIETIFLLEDVGITRHTPAVWLRGPFSVITARGRLDLRSVPDCIGLTPKTIEQIVQVEGHLECWRILENRTVFERVARKYGEVDGVIWIPGFGPSWWKKGIRRILNWCPAPALIACDPDPAGIQIALEAGQLWEGQNLSWEPWHMDVKSLSSLPRKKTLNEDDKDRLQRLLSKGLPPSLNALSAWMLENGEKGEQEGLAF